MTANDAGRVAVFGLDRLGTSMATLFALKGGHVAAWDVDTALCARLADGHNPWPDEPELTERLQAALRLGRLTFVDAPDAVRDCKTWVIYTPITLDEDDVPCRAALERDVHAVGRALTPDRLVLFAGLLGLGDTRTLGSRLEQASGLRPGKDFRLGYLPPRVAAGHVFGDILSSAKFVSGIDAASMEAATICAATMLDTIVTPLQTCEAAELTRLWEGASSLLGQALALEAAHLAEAHGIDAAAAARFANSQPEFPVAAPSLLEAPGDATLALALLGEHPGLLLPAAALAARRRSYAATAEQLATALDGLDGRRVTVVGRKGGAGAGARIASAFLGALRRAGAQIVATDAPDASGCDAVIVGHDGADFDEPPLSTCRAVVDAANLLHPEHVRARGLAYVGVGR